MKKIYIVILLVLTGMMAVAQTSVWNGNRAFWTKGTGTENDPYLLESAEHLAYFAYIVNKGYNTTDLYFRLTTDIDLNGSEDLPWIPIGLGNRWFSEDGCDRRTNSMGFYSDSHPSFLGHFDGGGHCIFNIYVDGEPYAGLFGMVQGTTDNPVVIENVFVINGTVAGATSGGIVGKGINAQISHCWNGASISGTFGGGIIGDGGNLDHCYNTGPVTGTTVGGIVGQNARGIEQCYNSGSVTGEGQSHVGGILGRQVASGITVNNCYNIGTVSAIGPMGSTSPAPAAGGLIGLIMRQFEITNSYNVGEVSGSNHVGCLFGYGQSVVVENSYYLDACTESEMGTASTADFMRSQEFVDLLNAGNKETVWIIDSNNLNDGFPVLAGTISLVDVTSNPAEAGEVTGAGAYMIGTFVTVTVTPTPDYLLNYWSKDGERVSEELSYTFAVTHDCKLVANLTPSVVEELKASALMIRPNPTQGQFVVEGTGKMTIMNLLGQTVLTKDVEGQTTVNLSRGIYFVQLGNVTQKVIVE